jgi:hypothetical protein
MSVELLQQKRILIRNALHKKFSVLFNVCQRPGKLPWHFPVHRRNAMAMRVELWVTQLCSNALFEPLRDEMFQALSFLVDPFERVLQDFVEECFDQAMMTQHLKRSPPPGG